MKILKESDKKYIAKRLAAICYIACHWETDDPEFIEKVLNNVSDIAFRVGGMKMMDTDIPALVSSLEKHSGVECACASPCYAQKKE